MKNTYIFILTLFLFFFIIKDTNAQKIKNIHQNNGAILRVPTRLVDKAQLVDENGVQMLKINQQSGYVIQIPTSEIDSITHLAGNAVDPELLGELRPAGVMGVVNNALGLPVPFATVKSAFCNQQTTTDANGVFFMDDILVYEKLGFIKVEKPGYFSGSRSFLPLSEGRNMLQLQLLHRELAGSFSSSLGGDINAGSLQINFPANSFTRNNQAYSGTVKVYAKALNPNSDQMFDQMPGDLLGGMNDNLQILRSFGMAAIEITDLNGVNLQLQSGSSATLQFTIPESMLSEAPDQIEFWSFDEQAGYWQYETMSQREDNMYIAQAQHFSWWNCDIPANFVELKGVVRDTEGNLVSGVRIEVITQTFGKGILYSNSEGSFSGLVPRNQNIEVNLQLTCITNSDWTTVFSQNLGALSNNLEIELTGSMSERFNIIGILMNCDSLPVQKGYVTLFGVIFFVNEGHFSVPLCATGNYTFRGFDTETDSIKVSENVNVVVGNEGADAGSIDVCSDLYGSVTDIDGNKYLTVMIGNQEWMAENLKTTRYADGFSIPNITNNTAWVNQFNDAWCNFLNNETYGQIYGKLYNGFAVNNPRNLCPTNWHVPSDEEWQQLELLLGTNGTDVDQFGFIGNSANVGGQMKAINLWLSPNIGATNSSGFSGLPGGHRDNFSGEFNFLYSYGFWWSSNEDIQAYDAWSRSLSYNNNGYKRSLNIQSSGFSVRCVKD
jgi:uncharacterized protein (TIGR02145 family)